MRRLPTISQRLGRLSAGVALVCLSGAGSCLAETVEPGPQALRFSGFGTVGVSHTSAPQDWGFQRDGSQPRNTGGTRFDTDSRLGLQANYSPDPRFEVVGQLLLTRRVPYASTGDSVASAFAAYRPTENLSLRVGRVIVNSYLLGEYRSVGLAYPSVRPTDLYHLLPSSLDGFDITQSWRDRFDATWTLNGYYGSTKQSANRTDAFFDVRPIYGATLTREEQGLSVKARVARGKLSGDLPQAAPLIAALQQLAALPVPQVAAEAAALQQGLVPDNEQTTYIALGLNLDRHDWLLMAEISQIETAAVRLGSHYVLLGHRFGRASPYAVTSTSRIRASSGSPQWAAALTPVIGPDGAAQAQALGDSAYNAATIGPRQRTFSVGLRWDLSAQTALKFQYDRIRIGANGSLFWANGTDDAGRARVMSAVFDFIF